MEAQKVAREERPRNIAQSKRVFDPELSRQAAIDAFKKLDPRTIVKNPVMFVVEVGTVIVGFLAIYYVFADPSQAVYNVAIFFWLLLTVLVCTFVKPDASTCKAQPMKGEESGAMGIILTWLRPAQRMAVVAVAAVVAGAALLRLLLSRPSLRNW
jgi:hypothetical protein